MYGGAENKIFARMWLREQGILQVCGSGSKRFWKYMEQGARDFARMWLREQEILQVCGAGSKRFCRYVAQGARDFASSVAHGARDIASGMTLELCDLCVFCTTVTRVVLCWKQWQTEHTPLINTSNNNTVEQINPAARISSSEPADSAHTGCPVTSTPSVTSCHCWRTCQNATASLLSLSFSPSPLCPDYGRNSGLCLIFVLNITAGQCER